ncbi:MAG: RIP metalloprotease RseP [Patescibacteria group bacterium]
MNIIIFIIVLAILIFVHELGHFIFAKKTGLFVEEFSIGFPPRIFSFKKGETKYSVGAIPLGGYVKIFGEDYDTEDGEKKSDTMDKNYHRRFTNQSKKTQALVLVAGVAFNILLAWLFFSIAFMSGMSVSVGQFGGELIKDPNLILLDVLPNSPAEEAGLEAGDIILYLNTGSKTLQNFTDATEAQIFIASSGGQEIEVLYKRAGETILTRLVPADNIIAGKSAIGVSFDVMGTAKFSAPRAVLEGAKTTMFLTVATVLGLANFIVGIFTGASDLSQISGPVGIVSLVGNAFEFGWVYLLSFTALISINLAVINLFPIPALDGGRLLFILIEAIKKSPIKPRVANMLNLAGFSLLILLMVVITFNDVVRLF